MPTDDEDDGDEPVAKKKKKRKPAAKKGAGKRKPARGKGGGWRRWLLIEASTILAGAALGLALVGLVLWGRARKDVRAWLEHPPTGRPSYVLSAPIHVREGMHVSASDVAGELLSAGYERVDAVSAPHQFSLT